MNEWTVRAARHRFKELLDASEKEPQVIRRHAAKFVIVPERLWQKRKPSLFEALMSDDGRTEDLIAGSDEFMLDGGLDFNDE